MAGRSFSGRAFSGEDGNDSGSRREACRQQGQEPQGNGRMNIPKKFLSLFADTQQRGINHDMKTDTQKFKTVATFNDRLQAEITAGMLRENGIPAGVFGADSSYPSLGFVSPVEVKVNEEDYDAAMQLLNESPEQ